MSKWIVVGIDWPVTEIGRYRQLSEVSNKNIITEYIKYGLVLICGL